MSEREPLTGILADFVSGRTAQLPETVMEPAKYLVLDTVGVALAAAKRPIGQLVAGHIARSSGPAEAATVLGLRIKSSSALAAWANGTLANALDFDEGSHLCTHVLPVALALAEENQLSGRELLDAFVIGYESGARLTQVIDVGRRQQRGPTARGWWHVGLVGPIAAALTACRALKLDRRQTMTAMGIASCSSGGFRRNMGTMAKALHSGNAARAGIEAACLAQQGFTSDPAILEAPLGFLQALCLPDEQDTAAIADRLGRPYALEGLLRIKRFPACNPGHPLIDAALGFAENKSVSWTDIELIEADLHTFSLLRLDPTDEDAAGFSGAFLLAATLVNGAFGLDQLNDETLHDARVQGLMQRIRHVPAGKPEAISIRLRGNRTMTIEVPPGRRLTSLEDIREKYRLCASTALTSEAVEALDGKIMLLEENTDVSDLMAIARDTREIQSEENRPGKVH